MKLTKVEIQIGPVVTLTEEREVFVRVVETDTDSPSYVTNSGEERFKLGPGEKFIEVTVGDTVSVQGA